MNYRIVNIDYWKQFSNDPRIQNWMNDEAHTMPDDLVEHGLAFNCINPTTDPSMEDWAREAEEKNKPVEPTQSEGFKCDVCGKVCKNKLGLGAHKRSHK